MDGWPAIAGYSGTPLKPDFAKIAVTRFTNAGKQMPQREAGGINGGTPETDHGTGLP